MSDIDLQDLQGLVDAADDAALLRAVDGLAASRQWDVLADLARRCRDAVELGKQLWGVAMHIDYRLAWEGPAEHAGAALRPGAGRFALGPLTEVAASTHPWDELAPYLSDPATNGAVAQERVIRGEDLRGRPDVMAAELPLALTAWEPRYALPRYRDRSALFPAPPLPDPADAGRALPRARAGALDDGGRALADTVRAWSAESDGVVAVACVEGDALDAIGALAAEAEVAELAAAEALALLQWAGASGGARGRRPGGAAGRFAAWWTAAALTGLSWPEEGQDDLEAFAADLGAAVSEVQWLRWRPPGPETGWVLRLAVTDPADGLAWAIDAHDTAPDDLASRPAAAEG